MNPRLNRRSTLGGIGAALLAACAHPALAKRARRPLGLTDITVRKELAADYAGTLRAVAALGYSHFGFRLSDYAPDSTEPSAAEKARMVRDAGLALGPVRLNPVGKDPDREIAAAAGTGARIIALDGKCREAGLRLAYHNHWWGIGNLSSVFRTTDTRSYLITGMGRVCLALISLRCPGCSSPRPFRTRPAVGRSSSGMPALSRSGLP